MLLPTCYHIFLPNEIMLLGNSVMNSCQTTYLGLKNLSLFLSLECWEKHSSVSIFNFVFGWKDKLSWVFVSLKCPHIYKRKVESVGVRAVVTVVITDSQWQQLIGWVRQQVGLNCFGSLTCDYMSWSFCLNTWGVTKIMKFCASNHYRPIKNNS